MRKLVFGVCVVRGGDLRWVYRRVAEVGFAALCTSSLLGAPVKCDLS